MISGKLPRDVGGGEQRALGVLEGRALGQVDDDRDLGLVVEGQQLDRDALGGEQRQRQQRRDADAEQEDPGRALAARRSAWRSGGRGGRARLRRARVVRRAAAPSFGASRSISQGVTITATKNENSIAADALAGIGPCRGPSGRTRTASAAARRPRSASRRWSDCRPRRPPRSRLHARRGRRVIAQWRAMFSITTMASSTRMPIEKISANRLTRLIV